MLKSINIIKIDKILYLYNIKVITKMEDQRIQLLFLYNAGTKFGANKENIISKLSFDVVNAIVKDFLPKRNRSVIKSFITFFDSEYHHFLKKFNKNELLCYMRKKYVMPDGSEIPDSFHLGRYIDYRPKCIIFCDGDYYYDDDC